MAQFDQQQSAPADTERDARAERILDAAAELLLTWGYRRVTIDDVAKRAGIGKGTVYLHFQTKELLFLTVLLRSQAAMVEPLIEAVRHDPERARPGALARSNYLMAQEEPVARAVLLGDSETLGSLVESGTRELGDFVRLRLKVLTGYLETLREHGVVRTDAPLELQLQAYFRTFYGYIALEPLTDTLRADPAPGAEAAADAETGARTHADMLAHVVGSALETSDDPALIRAAAPRIVELFQRLLTGIYEEIDRQKRT